MISNHNVPFAIGEIDHIVLRVENVARAITFYSNVLGAREERRVDSIGLVQMRAGRSLIDLVPLPEGHSGGGGNVEHFALTISPFEPEILAEHLATNGLDCGQVERRYGAGGFGPSIYIKDPDGNVVELKGPASSDQSGAQEP